VRTHRTDRFDHDQDRTPFAKTSGDATGLDATERHPGIEKYEINPVENSSDQFGAATCGRGIDERESIENEAMFSGGHQSQFGQTDDRGP
jgi:hypothetical protein